MALPTGSGGECEGMQTLKMWQEESWICRLFSAERMLAIAALWFLSGEVSVMAQQRPPKLLEIYREPLKQGSEAA